MAVLHSNDGPLCWRRIQETTSSRTGRRDPLRAGIVPYHLHRLFDTNAPFAMRPHDKDETPLNGRARPDAIVPGIWVLTLVKMGVFNTIVYITMSQRYVSAAYDPNQEISRSYYARIFCRGLNSCLVPRLEEWVPVPHTGLGALFYFVDLQKRRAVFAIVLFSASPCLSDMVLLRRAKRVDD